MSTASTLLPLTSQETWPTMPLEPRTQSGISDGVIVREIVSGRGFDADLIPEPTTVLASTSSVAPSFNRNPNPGRSQGPASPRPTGPPVKHRLSLPCGLTE